MEVEGRSEEASWGSLSSFFTPTLAVVENCDVDSEFFHVLDSDEPMLDSGIDTSMTGLRLGLKCTRLGDEGETTYGRDSGISTEVSSLMEEPLFCMFVGVSSLGASKYDGGPPLYRGGAFEVGVDGLSISMRQALTALHTKMRQR